MDLLFIVYDQQGKEYEVKTRKHNSAYYTTTQTGCIISENFILEGSSANVVYAQGSSSSSSSWCLMTQHTHRLTL